MGSFPTLSVLVLDTVTFGLSVPLTLNVAGDLPRNDPTTLSTIVVNHPSQDSVLAALSLWTTVDVKPLSVTETPTDGQLLLLSDAERDFLTEHIAMGMSQSVVIRLQPCTVNTATCT